MDVLQTLKKLIDARITNKSSLNSISPDDVGRSIKEVVDQFAIGIPSPSKTYPGGFIGRDSQYNLYVAAQSTVDGDIEDRNKWKRVFEEFKYELVVETNNQTLFILTPIPLNINLVSLYLNGQRLYLTKDFTVNNLGALNYISSVLLDTTDALAVEYLGFNI